MYYCCNCFQVAILSGEESIYDSPTFGSLICKTSSKELLHTPDTSSKFEAVGFDYSNLLNFEMNFFNSTKYGSVNA